MKKLLAMVLALVMTLSLAVSASAFKDDKDISADYAEAVAVLDGMGVFKGYEDGSFKPTGDITRAEVATIIYRIYTGDVAKSDKSGLYATYNKFSDMTGAGWAAGYIGYCANAELVKGYPDGTFRPNQPVTRQELVTFYWRYANLAGCDMTISQGASLAEYQDGDSVKPYAKEAMLWAVDTGLIRGVDANTLAPNSTASRAMAATMLYRMVV